VILKIISHFAGVRDLPLRQETMVGTHQKHKQLHILEWSWDKGRYDWTFMAKALFDFGK
jgi:hypothetical protein